MSYDKKYFARKIEVRTKDKIHDGTGLSLKDTPYCERCMNKCAASYFARAVTYSLDEQEDRAKARSLDEKARAKAEASRKSYARRL